VACASPEPTLARFYLFVISAVVGVIRPGSVQLPTPERFSCAQFSAARLRVFLVDFRWSVVRPLSFAGPICFSVLLFFDSCCGPASSFLLLCARGSSISAGGFSFLLNNPTTGSCSTSSPTCGVLWPQQLPIVFGFFSAPSSLHVLCLVLAASHLL
jgi:hypothetical protein